MPSYDELDNEVWWVREYEPPALAVFNSKLRAKYGLTRSQCGSKGDNLHTRGRHRSRAWCLNSRYCTDRSYATTDGRDRRGPEDALRATDLGLQGPALWAVCRRVDAAVRAGRLPQLAEWFGTFDGRTVVGWSNGRPASSDSSHLYHGHFGYWTESANDEAFFTIFFGVITGDDMSWDEPITISIDGKPVTNTARNWLAGTGDAAWKTYWKVQANEAADAARDAAVLTAVQALAASGGVDAAPIVAAIQAEAAATRTLVEQKHQEEMAALKRERDAEVAGLRAELDALTATS